MYFIVIKEKEKEEKLLSSLKCFLSPTKKKKKKKFVMTKTRFYHSLNAYYYLRDSKTEERKEGDGYERNLEGRRKSLF